MDHSNNIDSKFRFAIIVAKRAKQLINGAKQLVEMEAQNPLTIAIEEVNRGLVTAELLDSVNIYLKEVSLSGEDETETAEDEAAVDGDEIELGIPAEGEDAGMNLIEDETETTEEEEEDEEVTKEEI